jgi:hypothetical protein
MFSVVVVALAVSFLLAVGQQPDSPWVEPVSGLVAVAAAAV